jgi:hypothetical protein
MATKSATTPARSIQPVGRITKMRDNDWTNAEFEVQLRGTSGVVGHFTGTADELRTMFTRGINEIDSRVHDLIHDEAAYFPPEETVFVLTPSPVGRRSIDGGLI